MLKKWYNYIAKQQDLENKAHSRKLDAKRISSNSELVHRMSDLELRLHNLKSMHETDPIREKFNAAYQIVHNGSNPPSVTKNYEGAIQKLSELAGKYVQRTMTEEEFDFVDSRSPAALIYGLRRMSSPESFENLYPLVPPQHLRYNEAAIILKAKVVNWPF